MSNLELEIAKNKLKELKEKDNYEKSDLDIVCKIREDLVCQIREKEFTRQEDLKKKIHIIKESWFSYCKLNSDCKENGVHFLSNQASEIYEGYEKELKNCRVELCRERGE